MSSTCKVYTIATTIPSLIFHTISPMGYRHLDSSLIRTLWDPRCPDNRLSTVLCRTGWLQCTSDHHMFSSFFTAGGVGMCVCVCVCCSSSNWQDWSLWQDRDRYNIYQQDVWWVVFMMLHRIHYPLFTLFFFFNPFRSLTNKLTSMFLVQMSLS